MRRLTVFNQQSMDGYFSGAGGDTSWTHTAQPDPELQAFTESNARSAGVLVFGRTTYDMMAAFWPTPMAATQSPIVAENMNRLPKVVFSRSLTAAPWGPTTIVAGDLVTEMRRLKREPGPDLAILGSGSLVGPLVQAGLVDQLGILVIPVVLGAGRTMFGGVTSRHDFTVSSTRAFKSGRVYTTYEPRRG